MFVRDVQALPGDQTPPAKAHRRAPEAFAAGADPAPANGEHFGFASLNGSHPELTTFWLHDNRYAPDTFFYLLCLFVQVNKQEELFNY